VIKAVPVATGLANPWSFAFLPDGRILVTERSGALRYVSGGTLSAPLGGVPAVASSGQGGLLDLALGPDFLNDKRIYFTFAEPVTGGLARTAVARATLGDSTIGNVEVIYRQVPAVAGANHFGSRLVFDRFGYLFVTLGERFDANQAQRVQVSLGKVVRIRPDGSIPPDNPALMPGSVDTGRPDDAGPAHPAFLESGALPELWTMGHRNPQGAALHPETGELWLSEHGPRGGDEINRIRRGRNYGWPRITHGRDYDTGQPLGEGTTAADVEPSVHFWVPVSVAPAGIAFYTGDRLPGWKGSLLVGTLAGQHLVRLDLQGNLVTAATMHLQGVGRIRDVRQGPDGYPWFITDAGTLYRVEPQ
jgi:glucose/arabinose dehydrogenase